MAIINKIEEPSGIVVNDAYCRVEVIQLSRFSKAMATARYYKDKQSYDSGLPSFKEQPFEFDYDAVESTDNPYKAAYLYMKTLEEFKQSVDLY